MFRNLECGRVFYYVQRVSLPGLLDLRDAIDLIDAQMLDLLRQRLELVLKVGEIKSAYGVKVYDPDRERNVLAKLESMARPPMRPEMARRIYERIIDESRSIEQHHIQEK
jgi:chorismate mutase